MKHSLFAGILLSTIALSFAAGGVGCSSDDTLVGGGGPDGSTADVRADQAAPDTGTDTGTLDAGQDAGERCSAAKEQVLTPIDSVSKGEVSVYATEGNAQSIYVDASAGGPTAAKQNPRIYLKLASNKVTVTDRSAAGSTEWDVALKRDVIFTNSGDGGKGQGSAVFLADKPFADVTAADAQGKAFAAENFFNDDCTPKRDDFGSVQTTFTGWYNYNDATHQLTPKAGTWIVRTTAGSFFKLQILSYYSTPDGGTGIPGGFYTLKVEAL